MTRGYVLPTTAVKGKPQDEYVFPVYSSQTKDEGLMGYYNQYLYENAITWTTDGANAGTVHFRDGKFYCTNVCGVLLNEDGNANRCIAEILGSMSKKYVSYVGNPKLMNNVMSEIRIHIPSVAEQKKIDELISALDLRIVKQRELIEHLKKYKRGVVKAVFSGKLELSAEYPFQEWESKAICECLDYEQPQKYIVDSEKYDDSFATPVLTANKGFILGYTDEQQGIYDKGDVIIYDDFTMDMKYVTFNFKVKSSTIKMLTPTKGNDLYFMYSLLQSLELQPEGHQRSYISKVEPMIVRIPPYELQLKISEFLKNIDNRVALVEKELAFLVAQKQGLMQGLFA